jgi:hypothetical protein
MRSNSDKRQVADIMRSVSPLFVERDFDPVLPQQVLWSNFCRLDFCSSFDFSSLGVGVEDFADYFANVPVPFVQIPAASGHLGGFSFCHIALVECFSACKSFTSNAVGADGISVKFFKLLRPLIVVMRCMFSIMQSPLLFSLLCGVEGGYYSAGS